MTLHAELTREIDEGPSGPQIAAFFDLDRTLLAGFSAAHFIREDVLAGRMSAKHFAQTLMAATLFQLRQIGFSGFVATEAQHVGRFRLHASGPFERAFEMRALDVLQMPFEVEAGAGLACGSAARCGHLRRRAPGP